MRVCNSVKRSAMLMSLAIHHGVTSRILGGVTLQLQDPVTREWVDITNWSQRQIGEWFRDGTTPTPRGWSHV